MQEHRLVAYFSKKLHGVALNYLMYKNELYSLIQALKVWQHYLLPKIFIIFTDHESLKYLGDYSKLSRKHAQWVEFPETFAYTTNYK